MATRADVITTHVPARAPAAPTRPPGRKMVCWFDPRLLAKTAVKVAISTAIGEQADRRLLDALAMPDPQPADFTVDDAGQPRDELWFDYVADLGDGWNSTYAVALTVAQKTLTLKDPQGTEYATQGGDLLIFGGDEVYPVASVKAYEDRTVQPWESAIRGQRPAPYLFAVPGNHDWYDGLVSFMRLFCQGRTPPAWRTQQRRSYFSAKLPHGWWLIGTDVQLESDIDEPQVRYFEAIAQQMAPEDRIILCNAEPEWLLRQVRPPGQRTFLDNNLAFLQEQVFGKRVSVFLAGDLHHYRRHANDEGHQKIIAGGGGAFLHPTHMPKTQQELPGGFTQRVSFPTDTESQRLCWRNLGFLAHNPSFGLLTGGIYVLLSWALAVDVGAAGGRLASFGALLRSGLPRPGVLVIAALLVLGLIGFADKRYGKARWVAGLLHGVVHVFAAFVLAWGAAWLAGPVFGMGVGGARELVMALLVFAGGFVVGPTVMGIYLLISLNGFSAHPNEAFSALAIEDWKNFLRLRIDKDGRLWVFPVGIRRVPRAWKPGATVRDPEWVVDPADKQATPPMLIEAPLIIGGPPPPVPPGGGMRDLGPHRGPVYAGSAPP